MRGVHGEKLVALLDNEKLPQVDISRVHEAIATYDRWISDLNNVSGSYEEIIDRMIELLNSYKYYIDLTFIYDSTENFLYTEKGQTKIDNTVLEEFLPILAKKCIDICCGDLGIIFSSQVATYSSMYFNSSLNNPVRGGGINIKTKDQDFSMSRTLYLQSSYDSSFNQAQTIETHLGYVLAELKTNLDKTMFQEASATAHDVKQAVTGAKYYLLCDYLDMTPISTTTTDIDEILITRKARRIGSQIRKSFSTYEGRQQRRDWYINYLTTNPYSKEVFKRFIDHILSQIRNEEVIEENVLQIGYF